MTRSLEQLARAIPRCRRCPELRDYCAEVARTKRRAYANDRYWGKPVPGFGDPEARILILGLAPGAHGANRTGRMFTGDRSGDFLYAALHRLGLANQPTAQHRTDGLELHGVYITNACRCAPPANKPTPQQLANCAPFLHDELRALQPPVLLTLGQIAWKTATDLLAAQGHTIPKPRPSFGHGSEASVGPYTLLGWYHPSQQNVFTGRLTERMLEAVLCRAKELARG